jgi:hypothetical protein
MFQPGSSYAAAIERDNSPAGMAIRTCSNGSGKGGTKLKWWTIDVDFAASRSEVWILKSVSGHIYIFGGSFLCLMPLTSKYNAKSEVF